MAFSIFEDKAVEPDDGQLMAVLGDAFPFWKEIIQYVEDQYGSSQALWKFTGEKWGWNLRVVRKKRTILYFTPQQKFFINGFVFGGKAILAAEASGLPSSIIETIHEAPKYAEGTGFRVEVRKKADVENIKELIDIKIAN
ncbi:DUF3788 domain-containing protein [bacterium]